MSEQPSRAASASAAALSVVLAQDANLAGSLAGLSQLSVGWLGLEGLLTEVAAFAVRAIPGADGAGLTMLEEGRADVIVMSEGFVGRVDAVQYSLREGPCISAAATGQTMRSGSLGTDPRWPRFGPRAGRLGVHSVLSLPLITQAGIGGAMNVYAHADHAFDDRSEALGELFAAPAAIAVYNANILTQMTRLAHEAQLMLTSRAIIDQAIGIIRSRSGESSSEAFRRLRIMSQTQHVKLAQIATHIVEDAIGRARHRPPPFS